MTPDIECLSVYISENKFEEKRHWHMEEVPPMNYDNESIFKDIIIHVVKYANSIYPCFRIAKRQIYSPDIERANI